MIWIALGVFATTFALDFVWVNYTHAMTAHRILASANWAALIVLLSGVGIVAYASNPWMIIPGVAGAWAGTFLACAYAKPGAAPIA